jgi:hypothetical protein
MFIRTIKAVHVLGLGLGQARHCSEFILLATMRPTVQFYSLNALAFHTWKDAVHWFKAIGHRSAGLIRYLDLRF